MRKMMTKEVTQTTVKIVVVKNVDGQITTEQLNDVVMVGNVSPEKAQKFAHKEFGLNATVVGVEPETKTYELAVEEFIQIASLKEVHVDQEQTEQA